MPHLQIRRRTVRPQATQTLLPVFLLSQATVPQAPTHTL